MRIDRKRLTGHGQGGGREADDPAELHFLNDLVPKKDKNLKIE